LTSLRTSPVYSRLGSIGAENGLDFSVKPLHFIVIQIQQTAPARQARLGMR
jgi:hypothetical protein